MEDKKVGIVIPSFNQGKYIEQTILSILENKKYCDIDVVVMDGGSTDETLSILERYQDCFYFWTSEKDYGQADAINKGMRHLRHCDYVMWLNSDDVYQESNSVKKLLEYMCVHNMRIAYGKSYFIDNKGKIIGEYPTEKFSIENLGKRCYISQPSVMMEKTLWEECGGLDSRLQMCLDYELWMRIAKICTFGFYEGYVGNTRIDKDTKTATMQLQHLREAVAILKYHYGEVPIQWLYALYLEMHPQLKGNGAWKKFKRCMTHIYFKLSGGRKIIKMYLPNEYCLEKGR